MATGTIKPHFVQLWENPSCAEFAAQTVSLDLSGFSMIVIVFARYRRVDGVWASANNLEMDSCIVPSAKSTGFNTRFALYGFAEYNRYRLGYVSNTGVVFEDGSQYSNYGANSGIAANNAVCIPYRIYGVR